MQQEISEFLETMLTVEPRNYQLRIIAGCLAAIAQNRSVIIESPTGSGKTLMGLALASFLQKRDGFRVGWCTMRRTLLEQAELARIQYGINLDVHYFTIYEKNPPEVDLLIVDEAHHDAADTMVDLHAMIKPKKVIGLSATPFRSDKLGLFFERVVREASMPELIRDGHLANYDHFMLPIYTPQAVVDAYLYDRDRWGKSLMFFHRNEQCLEAMRLLEMRGISCTMITAGSAQDRQIQDFRLGIYTVAIGMMVLTEGCDVPDLQSVFVKPSVQLLTIQMSGRVLRCYNDRVKNIIQSVNTPFSFTNAAPCRHRYVLKSGSWHKLDTSKVINSMCRSNQRSTLAHKLTRARTVRRLARRVLE